VRGYADAAGAAAQAPFWLEIEVETRVERLALANHRFEPPPTGQG
jgi:hypothetical protein